MSNVPFQENTEGLWLDLPAEAYHKAEGCSNSMLAKMNPPARLPAYLAQPRDVTPAMMLGTLVHQRVLEPERPLPRFTVRPDGMDFRKADGKAWKLEQALAGRIILDRDEYDGLCGGIAAVREHPACNETFAKGHGEVSIFVKCERTGVLRKMRLDWVPEQGDCIVDVKTTAVGGGGPMIELADRAGLKFRPMVNEALRRYLPKCLEGEAARHREIADEIEANTAACKRGINAKNTKL